MTTITLPEPYRLAYTVMHESHWWPTLKANRAAPNDGHPSICIHASNPDGGSKWDFSIADHELRHASPSLRLASSMRTGTRSVCSPRSSPHSRRAPSGRWTTCGNCWPTSARSTRRSGDMIDVKPGQTWEDADPRSAGRTLRVDAIEDGKALCTVLTNTDETQRYVDGVEQRPAYSPRAYQDMRGKQTRISLARFKSTSTGYRLISEG